MCSSDLGTTLTKDAPANQLTVSRAKQISLQWQRPVKKESAKKAALKKVIKKAPKKVVKKVAKGKK